MDFTPITTQEQFDQAISERLKRERESTAKKYADYDDLKKRSAEYETQINTLNKSLDDAVKKAADHEKTVGELQAKVSAYETNSVKMRIAQEMGIPFELAGRLSGDNEDAIREDAKTFSQYVSKAHNAPPLRDSESGSNEGNNIYRQVLKGLKGA